MESEEQCIPAPGYYIDINTLANNLHGLEIVGRNRHKKDAVYIVIE